MARVTRSRELYKFTLQHKAVQDIMKAFSQHTESLELGEKAKLNQRGTSLLLNLIKTKSLRTIRFGDCCLKKEDLQQISKLLSNQTHSLTFRNASTFGIEGCILIKAILKRQPVKKFSVPDNEFTQEQLTKIIEGLQIMKCKTIDKIDLKGSNLGVVNIVLLRELMFAKHVRKLVVAHCHITTSLLKQIGGGITAMKGMMDHIDLRGNLISKKDIEAFRKTVENKTVEITFY